MVYEARLGVLFLGDSVASLRGTSGGLKELCRSDEMGTFHADATDSDLLAAARALGHRPGPAMLDPFQPHLHYVCCERCATVLYQSELYAGSRAFQFDGENETARLSACAAITA